MNSTQSKGNLLIRPRPATSRSPYNFEIVLLDHGLYFDLDRSLRINYSKLWLALISPASPENSADRRKYAQLVGNVDSDKVSLGCVPFGEELIPLQYPIFEAALTGECIVWSLWYQLTCSWRPSIDGG
jgi:aarF domain-containing kinase